MQCEPESVKERFAIVVQVLAAVGVVSVAVETLWRRPFASDFFIYFRLSLSSLVVSSSVDLLFPGIVGILNCAIVVSSLL